MSMFMLCPVTMHEANAFVAKHHRHHDPVRGCRFTTGVAHVERREIVGVAMVGRPVARTLQDGWTVEVNRLCVEPKFGGPSCVASMLYGACRRAAFDLGYFRILTYILAEEPGTSLKAAGWVCCGPAGGGSWSRKDRQRTDTHPTGTKIRWECVRTPYPLEPAPRHQIIGDGQHDGQMELLGEEL